MGNNESKSLLKKILWKILVAYDRFAFQIGDTIFTMAKKVKRTATKRKRAPKQNISKQLTLSFNTAFWKELKATVTHKAKLVTTYCESLKQKLHRFSLVGQFLKYAITVVLVIIVLATALPLLPVPGGYEPLVVMSGSMEPTIKVGSIAIIKPAQEYTTGDIITFKDPSDPNNTITHRIHEIREENEETTYITKGDINNAPDNWRVKPDDIKGKYSFSIPYLGYLVNFAKTPRGFILLVIIPAILIILDELRVIKLELERKIEEKYEKSQELRANN